MTEQQPFILALITMSPLCDRILKTVECLSIEEQQQVLDFVECLQAKHQSQIPTEPEITPRSFFDVAQSAIGAGEGPGDLSTNPDYMQGYGQ